jgi:putative ABC transport system permease protein
MRLLGLISQRYVRRHRLRSLLTVGGIVLGVGVFVAIHTANQSVLAAFKDTIIRIAGKTQLQVSAGEPGFDENVLEKLQELPEIRTAAPLIEVVVATGSSNLLILGVDLVGDSQLRSYELEDADAAMDDPLVFLALPDSLLVTNTFAEKHRLHVNSTIPEKPFAGGTA